MSKQTFRVLAALAVNAPRAWTVACNTAAAPEPSHCHQGIQRPHDYMYHGTGIFGSDLAVQICHNIA